jgi:23S rRNA pseudouridine1911/1915/1917 synthase
MLTASDILYEDNHLIVVNKKPGEIVQGDETGDVPLGDLVKGYIRKKYNKPGDVFLGVTHRLDRPVSGAVIFARTSKALARINEMLKERTIQKTYWAVVKEYPRPESGKLVHYLRKDNEKNRTYASDIPTREGKRAELDYELINRSDKYSLLEINLHTGAAPPDQIPAGQDRVTHQRRCKVRLSAPQPRQVDTPPRQNAPVYPSR